MSWWNTPCATACWVKAGGRRIPCSVFLDRIIKRSLTDKNNRFWYAGNANRPGLVLFCSLSEVTLNALIIVHHPSIFDTLTQILNRIPAKTTWLKSLDLENLSVLEQAQPDFVLFDPYEVLPTDRQALRQALRVRSGNIPLVALLPEDTRECRSLALEMGANAVVRLDQAASELLPELYRVFSSRRLVEGLSQRFEQNAAAGAPLGESAQAQQDRQVRQQLTELTQAVVERMSYQPSVPAAEEGQVFLRGLRMQTQPAGEDLTCTWGRTACNLNCGEHYCGLKVKVRGGRVVKVEPADFPDPRYRRLCLKGISHVQAAAHPDRLLYPLKRVGQRGAGKWQRISWEQALDEIYQRMTEIQGAFGSEAMMFFPYSGQLSALNGLAGTYLRLASLMGASGTNLNQFGLDSAVPSGIVDTFGEGSGYRANDFSDLVNTRLLLIWGANPIYSRMNWWQFFINARQAGCRMVTIDPKFSATAAKSDEWLPLQPGSDLFLALGLVNEIIRRELYDKSFVVRHTSAPLLVDPQRGIYLRQPANHKEGGGEPLVWDTLLNRAVPVSQAGAPALTGEYRVHGVVCRTAFDLLAETAASYTPELVAGKTGLPAERICQLAEDFARQRPARIFTLYGVDRWSHGATFGRLIAILAALTGNLGLPGAGAGVDGLSDGIQMFTTFKNPEGRQYLPVNPAQLSDYILDGKPYPIRGVFTAFNNWLNQWPDQNFLRQELLPHLDLLVCADLFMTETAAFADYVLPAAHLFEREDMVRGPGPYVQYQPALVSPPSECRSDFEITAGLAARAGLGSYFSAPLRQYLQETLDMDPSCAGLSIDDLKRTGVLERNMGDHSPVVFHTLEFATPTGRVEFYVERLAPYGQALPVYTPPIEADLSSRQALTYPFVCVTEHSRYRVHSTFVNNPWLRELETEPAALIHPKPAASRGVREGDLVRLFNDRGEVVLRAHLNQAVPTRAVYITQGWQSGDYMAGHIQSLTHGQGVLSNAMGPNTSFSDVLVDFQKADLQETKQ